MTFATNMGEEGITLIAPEDEVWHPGDVLSARAGECTELLAALNSRNSIVGDSDPEMTVSSTEWKGVRGAMCK